MIDEYAWKAKELDWLLAWRPGRFAWIHDKEIIYLLVAMSVYYRHVLMQLDAASRFFNHVSGEAEGVMIGSFVLSGQEAQTFRRVLGHFHGILRQFTIPSSLFDYADMTEFLHKAERCYKASQPSDASDE